MRSFLPDDLFSVNVDPGPECGGNKDQFMGCPDFPERSGSFLSSPLQNGSPAGRYPGLDGVIRKRKAAACARGSGIPDNLSMKNKLRVGTGFVFPVLILLCCVPQNRIGRLAEDESRILGDPAGGTEFSPDKLFLLTSQERIEIVLCIFRDDRD